MQSWAESVPGRACSKHHLPVLGALLGCQEETTVSGAKWARSRAVGSEKER